MKGVRNLDFICIVTFVTVKQYLYTKVYSGWRIGVENDECLATSEEKESCTER